MQRGRLLLKLRKYAFCATTKGFKTHLPFFSFEGVLKYWTYSKTSVKRLEGVQNYLLCVNLKEIIYKSLFYKRKNHHKDIREKLVKCVIKYKHLLQALSKY